jgi:hypothetical protein
MPRDELLDFLPLWGLFVGTVTVVLLAVEGGYLLGRYRRRRAAEEKEAPVGAMVAATLALLGFMLAFTFGMAGARFDGRRQVLLDEANAIGTAYLRAGLLPESHREDIRNLLREYVEVRVDGVQSGQVGQAVHKSEELHKRLWAQAVAVGEKNPNSIMAGLFIQSLNEVIDLHEKRVTLALRNRIPGIIWAALYLLAILAMSAMGYHAGLAGTTRSLAILALAVTFSAVIYLIADLDRPQDGLLHVSQQALIDVRESMKPK